MTIPRSNLLGAGLFVIAGISILITKFIFKLPDPIVMIIAGLVLIILDAATRLKSRPNPGWAYKKELGGYFFFFPAWALGVIVVIANLINYYK
jgi:hypothetical protein